MSYVSISPTSLNVLGSVELVFVMDRAGVCSAVIVSSSLAETSSSPNVVVAVAVL